MDISIPKSPLFMDKKSTIKCDSAAWALYIVQPGWISCIIYVLFRG